MASHYKGSAETTLALSAYINLVRATDSLRDLLSRQVEASGLTLPQFGVLEMLLHLGPLCQRAIGAKLLRSGGNMTLVIDNLERNGWVRRERQHEDRRLILVHLTPAGRKVIASVFPEHARTVRRAMRAITPSAQQQLRAICRQLGTEVRSLVSKETKPKHHGENHDSSSQK
jgi:MarR family transcriptional regulator, 2-MHQ and catechol-resistance regulon repressor